ncbi:protein of unknown function [Streptomyces sp. DvalAA-14]|uniref:DUF2017 domain-containing protein n=1 Tax=unclassified Streptomyces TaxID=2593676 RepID=UPI00081B3420|nr:MULTISPECIES: DUF2017 domain-containing protein [unclassified Streptomyces]MYS18818.1 DUF2017 family protein [Streptomyces sp. SID4948]SCD29926.1 protein of unknown function [Streptomyces sp. DvalAA-14]
MARRRARLGVFEPVRGGGAAITLDEVEISILRSLLVSLLELIGPGEPPPGEDDDPLAALFAEGPSKPPEDPALARLFPDAYEKTEDASDFRRFTENDLRTRKRDDALAMVRTLDLGGPVVRLSADQSRQWLGALNDLRLTLGARLEVGEGDEDGSSELYALPDDDERKPLVMAYLWLGGLQESLVETLMK